MVWTACELTSSSTIHKNTLNTLQENTVSTHKRNQYSQKLQETWRTTDSDS